MENLFKVALLACLIVSSIGSTAIDAKERESFLLELTEAYPRLSVSEVAEFGDLLIRSVLEHKPDAAPEPFNFTCEVYGPSVPTPTSVHRLRPADVKVVASMGDSITAGFGAKANLLVNIFAVLREYRGVSWDIGGDESGETVTTLPNLLRYYNPSLVGASVKYGKQTSKNSNFNFAVSGSRVKDLYGQAQTLVAKMKADSNVDFENDWKVVSVFIGGNDLCGYCDNITFHSPDNYEAFVRQTLTYLQAELPRTFVNLVLNIDVTRLRPVGGWICQQLHKFECPCATGNNVIKRNYATQLFNEYNDRLVEIANDAQYASKEDFTVVMQPFFNQTLVPLTNKNVPDTTYFSPDCFHFSEKAHFAAAEALWNSMIEPVGAKRQSWNLGEPLECPAVGSFLRTAQN